MKLITITGASGVGKDTVARMMSELTGWPLLCSYTTRPMREGEVNGREHFFVKECLTDKRDMLAYTVYGDYEYWTEVGQLTDTSIYVIDEEGLRDLHDRFPGIELVTITVLANRAVRRVRGVTDKRMNRDRERQLLPLDYYDYRIYNNTSQKALREKVEFVVGMMKMMDSEPSPFIPLVKDVKKEPVNYSEEDKKRIKKKYGVGDE